MRDSVKVSGVLVSLAAPVAICGRNFSGAYKGLCTGIPKVS